MYIITKNHGIFNTDCISEIVSSGTYIMAISDKSSRIISYNAGNMETIAAAIKANKKFVEVD